MKNSATDKRRGKTLKPEVHGAVSLKELAAHLKLNPATVSVVLNDVPGRSIPQVTRDRIKAAAREMNYQPNLLARSLQSRRTQTIGILVPELGDGYHTQVMSGIGDQLIKAGYFYFTAHHRHQMSLVEDYTRLLVGRGAQGIIAIDTLLEHPIRVPAVAVAGHRSIEGVTNVALNHARAAELTLTHLHSLGHRKIAFMRGQPFSSDSDERWKGLVAAAERLGLEIRPELVVSLDRDLSCLRPSNHSPRWSPSTTSQRLDPSARFKTSTSRSRQRFRSLASTTSSRRPIHCPGSLRSTSLWRRLEELRPSTSWTVFMIPPNRAM
jgi:hypothetical protein